MEISRAGGAIEDEVDELVRVVRTRGAGGDAQGIGRQFAAFPGHDEIEVVVLDLLLGDVAVIFHDDVGFLVGQHLVAFVAGELEDIAGLDLLGQQGLDLDETVIGDIVERIARYLPARRIRSAESPSTVRRFLYRPDSNSHSTNPGSANRYPSASSRLAVTDAEAQQYRAANIAARIIGGSRKAALTFLMFGILL